MLDEKKDIFDKVIALPILCNIEPFYKKNKELLLYLFFGGLAFGVSIGSFALINIGFKIDVLVANVISWIITVLFAYFTNCIWVFKSSKNLKQLGYFLFGRIITLVVEEVILIIFINYLDIHNMIIKIIAQIIIIILNYIISKIFIFKK